MIKRSTKDKGEGAFHELKGKLKQKVGQLTNDPALEAKGSAKRYREKCKRKSATWKELSKNRELGCA